MNWVLAATLVCGASVFTACTNESSDNPSQEQAKKNRTEFIQHTRATMKNMAENMNFTSWNAANEINKYFNLYVLNNRAFNMRIVSTFIGNILQSIKPVEEGSELAKLGYQMYGTIDLSNFGYRFTMNEDNTDFDIEAADNFEVILNGYNPMTQQIEKGIYKLAMKADGKKVFKYQIPSILQKGLVNVIIMPSEFEFSIADKLSGTWADRFYGSLNNQVSVPEGTEYANLIRDSWNTNGTINTNIPGPSESGYSEAIYKADKNALAFSLAIDKVNHKADLGFSWEQNGQKMVDLALKGSGVGTGNIDIAKIDFTKFTSATSIMEVIGTALSAYSLDESKVTLLDDLTFSLSIPELAKTMIVYNEYKTARRNGADKSIIDTYTKQLNDLVTAEVICKGVNQTIPMRFMTTKFGVDYWAMPSYNFSDENGYVSLTDLLDPESITYGINIIDHAAAPMQQSIIVAGQLVQYLQTLLASMQQNQQQSQQQSQQ